MPVPAISTQTTYLTEFMDRMVAAELEYLPEAVPGAKIDSYAGFLAAQSGTPYIIHRLGEFEEDDLITTADLQYRRYTIVGRFVAGNVDAGTKEQYERWVYVFEPHIVTLYTQNQYLVSGDGSGTPDFSQPMKDMAPAGVHFERSTGTRYFDNKGRKNMVPQIGFEFRVDTVFALEIAKKYF